MNNRRVVKTKLKGGCEMGTGNEIGKEPHDPKKTKVWNFAGKGSYHANIMRPGGHAPAAIHKPKAKYP